MQRTVVIYDGLCGLCTQSVRLVRRLDWLRRLDYLDGSDWPTVQRRYPTLEQQAIMGAIHVITPEGEVLIGYDGVRRLTRELPPVMWLYPLLFLPGITWLGPRLYAWIAAHRRQFNRIFGTPDPCAEGTCRVHYPQE